MVSSTPMLLGQYRPLDSYLHRLDTRAKLVPVLAVMILGLATDSLLFYLIVLGALLAGLALSGVGAAALARSFRPVLILVLVTFAYHIIFTGRDTAALFDIAGFAVTRGGVDGALFYSLRLLLFVSIVFLVTLTSSPSELAEAFARVLRPLERLRVPVGDLSLVLFIAIRFIPILYQEFVSIRNAQMIRGVDFTGGFFARIRKTTSVIVPVLVAAINRADELALAMEARGYRSGVPRSCYTTIRFDGQSWLFAVGSLVLLVGVYYLTGRYV